MHFSKVAITLLQTCSNNSYFVEHIHSITRIVALTLMNTTCNKHPTQNQMEDINVKYVYTTSTQKIKDHPLQVIIVTALESFLSYSFYMYRFCNRKLFSSLKKGKIDMRGETEEMRKERRKGI